MTKAERIARGQTAERLIEELSPHILSVERRYVEWWTQCADAQQRDNIWHRYQALQSVLTDITSTIADGVMAEEERAHEH